MFFHKNLSRVDMKLYISFVVKKRRLLKNYLPSIKGYIIFKIAAFKTIYIVS